MTISADRVSDTEIKVGDTIYTFDAKATADSFQQCLGNDSVETCAKNHAPVSTRAAFDESGAHLLAHLVGLRPDRRAKPHAQALGRGA